MSLLIDGYNLLNATGIPSRGKGPGNLERARQALLNTLVESLPAEELSRTIVVFDGSESPWGVAKQQNHRGMTVMFASKDEDADTVIERLIVADSAPKRLTVVSSDHRLQRAANRRKAIAVDSDVWFARTAARSGGAAAGELAGGESDDGCTEARGSVVARGSGAVDERVWCGGEPKV